MSAESCTATLYDRYDAWKGWDKHFTVNSAEAAYYAAEIGTASLDGLDVLEIGFGSGSFLAWARA